MLPTPHRAKLATEFYDSDDAAPSRTPPLVRRDVILKPSSSPEYPTPPPKSPTPELSTAPKKSRRKGRTQPSQGDGVLIGVLAGNNNSDIATRAAEEPLNSASHSEAGDSDLAMEDGRNLAQVAFDAIKVSRHEAPRSRSCSPESDGVGRNRPLKLQTLELKPTSLLSNPSSQPAVGGQKGEQVREQSTPATPTTHGPDTVKVESRPLETGSLGSDHIGSALGRNGSHSTMISPKLRKHTIAPSEGSPMETLPAIQHSPNSQTGKSPSNQQNLPSLHHLALPYDTRSPKENDLRPLGMSPRHTFPLQSPSTVPLPSRATFPTPQARINGQFQRPAYPPTQPSPVSSTFSDTSTRGSHGHSQDATSMSPPRKHERQFYPGRQAPQNEDITPVSAESRQSATSSTENPLSAETMNTEGTRPILPPLSGGPYVGGGVFRCEHPGCTAVSFQTQYLLNSHANVHSQNRPHYCPVKDCSRSEGGKGFKRKNEMIRHGLVHRSPGYICPFCPEREHKYPRPDNLQRHVRVNHPDRDMNDSLLREVLDQRTEGGTRGRRRRLGNS